MPFQPVRRGSDSYLACMLIKDIREYFTNLSYFETLKGFSTKMVYIIDKLDTAKFFETTDTRASFGCIEVRIPNHDGYIAISYDSTKDHYTVEAWRDPQPLTSDYISRIFIRNLENPVVEIEEFIERVKPELKIGWK